MIKRISIILINFFLVHSAMGMIFDNRYMPLIQKPYFYIVDYPYHCEFDLFFATAKEAFLTDGDEGPMPAIFGPFDQAVMAKNFVAIGKPNPLPEDFQDASTIPWRVNSKFQTEGFHFRGLFGITKHWGIGFDWAVMRINSSFIYTLNASGANVSITTEDAPILDESRRQMFTEAGLSCGHSSQMGMGDLDLYMRFDWSCCYACKMRTINLGLRLGGLLPVGESRNINNPASIPFGGNGFWGVYISPDGEFELREDWKLGFLGRVSKRFGRRRPVRLLAGLQEAQFADGEIRQVFVPQSMLFGVERGTAYINPGVTAAFYPYFRIEGMREGLGMEVQYTIIAHMKDEWSKASPEGDVEFPVNLVSPMEESKWVMEDISFNIFYDFGKVQSCHSYKPIVEFKWDIPVAFIAAHGVPKTHKVALGMEIDF